MGTSQGYMSEHLEQIAKGHSRALPSPFEEALISWYVLCTLTGEGLEGYSTGQEISLFSEAFKNDAFKPARIRKM